jgi:hypothetical protein
MMERFSRTLTLVIALAVLAVVGLHAQPNDPAVGTWKLNVAKSKYEPGPAPKSLTVTIEPSGPGVKVTTKGVDAQGNPIETSYTANYDGKDYPVAGQPDWDAIALKRIDASTVEMSRKKAGKVVQTVTRVVSKDGKVYTSTAKGTNAKGETINNVLVFEKQ